ncbi:MAG: hypothetical protein Q4E49_03995 [Bacteroidales bacterium]|nr:hypothetical protein [Bacteroidales bacterium]
MKKLLIAMAMMTPMVLLAQKDVEKKLTKFEQFTSKTGKISKFVDVKMPSISRAFIGSIDTSIRMVMGEENNFYFYRIEEGATSSSVAHIAMIEYSDLVEINKALIKLVGEVEADCAANPDYLENRFITEDGFQIGYYVSKGKASWYLKLERYSNSTVFIKNAEALTRRVKSLKRQIKESILA